MARVCGLVALALAAIAFGGAIAARSAAPAGAGTSASMLLVHVSEVRTPASTLLPAPARIASECRSLTGRRAVSVLCPLLLPRGTWRVAHRTLRTGRCTYLADLETRPAGSGEAFHVLAGGRCERFSLTTRSGRWPALLPAQRAGAAADDMLGLIGSKPLKPGLPGTAAHERVRPRVLRRAWIAGHRGLLLAVERFEQGGGVHGGHMAAVWSQHGDGYVLSLHFAATGADRGARERELVSAAAAMSRSAGAAT